jgi:hypothetical protein
LTSQGPRGAAKRETGWVCAADTAVGAVRAVDVDDAGAADAFGTDDDLGIAAIGAFILYNISRKKEINRG